MLLTDFLCIKIVNNKNTYVFINKKYEEKKSIFIIFQKYSAKYYLEEPDV